MHFDAGSDLACFTISENGATATRNSKNDVEVQFVCASPIMSEGKGEIARCVATTQ